MVGNPIATVNTSSPGRRASFPNLGLVRALKATKLALEPLFTKRAERVPTYLLNSRSNSSVNLPAVSHPSSDESTRATKSEESRTLPETGTGSTPGLNGECCFRKASPKLATFERMSLRSFERSSVVMFPF